MRGSPALGPRRGETTSARHVRPYTIMSQCGISRTTAPHRDGTESGDDAERASEYSARRAADERVDSIAERCMPAHDVLAGRST
jgi:hypothetical protein